MQGAKHLYFNRQSVYEDATTVIQYHVCEKFPLLFPWRSNDI